MYLANAFSLQMITSFPAEVQVEEVSLEEVRALTGSLESAIGHADTARVLSALLGVEVPQNRVNVSLGHGDALIVAQLQGGRLPEGATTLPEGAYFRFFRVTVA